MADSDTAADADDRMRRRVPGSRLKLWVLMEADRCLLAGLILAVLFVLLVGLGSIDPAPLRQSVANKDPIETLFQALVTALITGVTLVVTINQLVLSQELGAVSDQRERMAGAMEFRSEVAARLDQPTSPTDPATFLRALVDESAALSDQLTDVGTPADEDLRDRVDEFATDLQQNAALVSRELRGARFGTYQVIGAALDYNYSEKIAAARQLRLGYSDQLADDHRRVLNDIEETLSSFGTAREHLKTLYIQWELIDLSRAVLYAALPALLVTTGMILFVDDVVTIAGTTLGIDNLLVVVSAATVVALLPFMLLLVYILRIATLTKRTLAIGPFVLRSTGQSTETDG